MQCPSCGGEMTTTRETYHYTDSGLSNIDLHDTEIRRCPSCGEEEVIIPAAESLHRSIAQQLAAKRGKLAPEEIRFLRKQLGFSGVDLAAHMGVAPETVSRWENGGQEIGPVADRLLRLLAITREPVEDYALETLRAVATGDAAPLRLELSGSRPSAPPVQGWSYFSVAASSTCIDLLRDVNFEPLRRFTVPQLGIGATDNLAQVA